MAAGVATATSSPPTIEAVARLTKLRQATDRLAAGAVRDFLSHDLQKTFAGTLPPGRQQWLSAAQTSAAAQLAQAAHSGLTDALHQHRAAELVRRLEGTHLGGGSQADGVPTDATVEPAEEFQERLRCHTQAAKLAMLKVRLREQELENEQLESKNKRLRAKAEELHGKLDSLTCSMMAPLLRSGGGGA